MAYLIDEMDADIPYPDNLQGAYIMSSWDVMLSDDVRPCKSAAWDDGSSWDVCHAASVKPCPEGTELDKIGVLRTRIRRTQHGGVPTG